MCDGTIKPAKDVGESFSENGLPAKSDALAGLLGERLVKRKLLTFVIVPELSLIVCFELTVKHEAQEIFTNIFIV